MESVSRAVAESSDGFEEHVVGPVGAEADKGEAGVDVSADPGGRQADAVGVSAGCEFSDGVSDWGIGQGVFWAVFCWLISVLFL